MGWKEGIGVLAIIAFTSPYIVRILRGIPGYTDDFLIIFAVLSWVVSAFLGTKVDTTVTKQIHDSLKIKGYMDTIKKNVPKGKGPLPKAG